MKLLKKYLSSLTGAKKKNCTDLVSAQIESLYYSIEDIRSSIRSIDTKFNIFLLILLLPATHLTEIYKLLKVQDKISYIYLSLLFYWFIIIMRALYIIKGRVFINKNQTLTIDKKILHYFFPIQKGKISDDDINESLKSSLEIKQSLKYEQLKLSQIFNSKYRALSFVSWNTMLLIVLVFFTIIHSLIWE